MDFNIFALLFFCHFPFLCDEWPPVFIDQQQFDFIIVGGGAAGSVLANRLSENPNISVLLLEAGDWPPFASEIPAFATKLAKTKYDWSYKAIHQTNTFLAFPNQQPFYPRGKVLGGSTTTNAMIYLRGNKNDFDQWEQMGLTGWSHENILPYFLKAEASDKTDGTNGPVTLSHTNAQSKALDAFLKAGEAAGYQTRNLIAENQTGFTRVVLTMRDGTRCSTALAYIVPAQGRPNLKILCNSRVTKILFNNNKEAYGVNFEQGFLKFTVKASKEVILSAGAINSPQLLMLSGVGPPDQLQRLKIPLVANLAGVGENLQDHVGSISLFWKVNCSECAYDKSDFFQISGILQWLLFHEGVNTIAFGVEAVGYVNTKYANKSANWPDVQLLLLSVSPTPDIADFYGVSRQLLEKYVEPIGNSRRYSIVPFIMRPKSRGSVKLQSKSPFLDPIIDLNMLSHPDDVGTLVEGLKLAFELGNSEAFKPLGAAFNPAVFPGCKSCVFLSVKYFECLARHMTFIYFHAVGTCKMGLKSDPMAVVDNNLNVFDVNNLRVVDASIMPTIVSANPMAATIMIGEKASDIIKQRYQI